MDDGSEPESMKDSNSYTEDSDSSTSIYGEAKPHSSLVSCGADSSEHTSSQLDGSNMEKANCGEEVGLQVLLNLEEQLLEFENHEDYIASEYGDDILEQCTNTELEDILYANSSNPNVYVLSSGRWTVNQGKINVSNEVFTIEYLRRIQISWQLTCLVYVLRLIEGLLCSQQKHDFYFW